ncbi:hypothetical protein MMC10_002347 [Thelotrema lepadinum]|nr:hypothetical protein [Thelotrema lepadinum]
MCHLLTALILPNGAKLQLASPLILECETSPHNEGKTIDYSSPSALTWSQKVFALEQGVWKTSKDAAAAGQAYAFWHVPLLEALVQSLQNRLIEEKCFSEQLGSDRDWREIAAERISAQQRIDIPTGLRLVLSPVRSATADEQELINSLFTEFK